MPPAPNKTGGRAEISRRSYGVGFVLALILTSAAFATVASGALPRQAGLLAIFGAAVVQIGVHLRFFLHLDASSARRGDVNVLVLAVLIIALVVGGTMWIMYHLSYNLS